MRRGLAGYRCCKSLPLATILREVAVTDGDKVAAQIKFGFSVNTRAVGDSVQVVAPSATLGDINASD